MEQVLDVYDQPYDPRYPVLCFDERPCQLIDDVLVPTPAQPGRTRREDYHYKRNGTAVVLLAVEPLTGKRIVEVSRRKTKKDYARFMAKVLRAYGGAEQIVLVQDNLNTHSAAAFYERYAAQKAFSMAQSIEMVFTPKKASWLNMAEIEFSALSKQCLDRRIGDFATLREQVNAWSKSRNRKKVKINWQFNNTKARKKFARAYKNICI
jgi:transposase